MPTELDRYKKDLASLLTRGQDLHLAMQAECFPVEEIKKAFNKTFGEKANEKLASLPDFKMEYQSWYSETKALIRQVLPDRLSDFVRYYEKPRLRKQVTYENYKIEDYMQGLTSTHPVTEEIIFGPKAAIPQFRQQLAILMSVKARFESSLFDIRHLVQAELFNSELDAARELASKGFGRAAGALAGVVLERHLGQICSDRGIKIAKKVLHISDFNEALKKASAIETSQWRFIQHLADLRNLCDHDKKSEPTAEQVTDLLQGVAKITKTVL